MSDEEDAASNYESESSSFSESPSCVEDRSPSPPRGRLTVNISETQYPVVRQVLKRSKGWRVSTDPENPKFDLWWTDGAVEPEKLARMKPYQKINHFPGMYALARKNFLARNLTKLRKVFPGDYDFYPLTWVLPAEFADLKTYSMKNIKSTYIVKPDASCQGRGIFLTKDVDELSPVEHFIVQRYVEKPFLIEDLKFDLRVYVLVAGCDPLRIFIHEEGLTRLATEDYCRPTESNMADMCMHLTNYAVNKLNPNFVFNEDSDDDDVGHKRSLTSTMRLLEDEGYNVSELKAAIADMAIKTLCTVQPSIAHYYRSCQPEDLSNGMCFELLGLDVLLDNHAKPWLLEVNHSPSFTTDTPLDDKIKKKVIGDAINLLNFNPAFRTEYLVKEKSEVQQRTLLGKSNKMSKEERETAWIEAQRLRDEWEASHLGGFTKVYPSEQSDKYDKYLKAAFEQWEEWTGANINRVKKEEPKREDAWLRASKKPPVRPRKHDLSLPHPPRAPSNPSTALSTDRVNSRPQTAADEAKSKERKDTVYDRLSKCRFKKPETVLHSVVLPNIYFSDVMPHGLLYVPPDKIYRPPSEIPIKVKTVPQPIKNLHAKEVRRLKSPADTEVREHNLRSLKDKTRSRLPVFSYESRTATSPKHCTMMGGMFVMPKIATFSTTSGITPKNLM